MAHQFEQSPLEGRDFVYYRLQPGDNLTVLERKFRITSADSILKLNPDLDSERLPVNREIKIPLQ